MGTADIARTSPSCRRRTIRTLTVADSFDLRYAACMLPPNIAAAQRFVDLVTKCDRPTIEMLSRHLDELALRYHDTPLGDPDESDECPTHECRLEQADVAARFPALGYYGSADPNEVPGEAYVGDAIDDIVDIANDLREVLWRYERFGPDDAHWYFRFLYIVHWGAHLRSLARYLHARLSLEVT